jgi:predicted N-acetyltransferase YhbS
MSTQTYRIRRVSSIEDLRACFAVLGSQFSPPIIPDDYRFERLYVHFEASRPLMIVAERDGEVVGGALGLVRDHDRFGVSIVAFDESVRGTGLARRVMQTVEVQAMACGAREIGLGSVRAARGFYERLGYSGKKTGKLKSLPLPGRIRDLKVAKLQAALGDLDEGELVATDADTGKVPALW